MDARLFKKPDILVFLFVTFLAVALILLGLNKDEQVKLSVTVDGKETLYSLDEDFSKELNCNGVTLTLNVKDGKAFVLHSDCKDKICENSGKISKVGQIIVCAPAGISIKIIGNGGAYDAISG